jgi:hypothetical protein
MSSTILFSETQRFTQWWIWGLLLGSSAIVLVTIYQQVSTDAVSSSLWLALAVTLLALGLFLSMRLETQLHREGIRVRLFPLHLRHREIPWSAIEKAYLRTYSPIREFGGWGLRFGPKGKAYNVSGNQGLQLELRNGKKLLIGTQKSEELRIILKSLGKLPE